MTVTVSRPRQYHKPKSSLYGGPAGESGTIKTFWTHEHNVLMPWSSYIWPLGCVRHSTAGANASWTILCDVWDPEAETISPLKLTREQLAPGGYGECDQASFLRLMAAVGVYPDGDVKAHRLWGSLWRTRDYPDLVCIEGQLTSTVNRWTEGQMFDALAKVEWTPRPPDRHTPFGYGHRRDTVLDWDTGGTHPSPSPGC